jgi:hypothetical protein
VLLDLKSVMFSSRVTLCGGVDFSVIQQVSQLKVTNASSR